MKVITGLVLPLLISSAAAKDTQLGDVLANGTVTAEWESSPSAYLDGPKLLGLANDTSYDWYTPTLQHVKFTVQS